MFMDKLLDGFETEADLVKFEEDLHDAIIAKKALIRKQNAEATRKAKAEARKKEVEERAKVRMLEVEVNREFKSLLKEEEKQNNEYLFNLCKETFKGRVKQGQIVRFRLYGKEFEGMVYKTNHETFHTYVIGYGFRDVQYGKVLMVA